MSIDKLWSLDDFKDFDTIDKVFFKDGDTETCAEDDIEGYTPLCFAALNGVAPECISYFMWKGNNKQIFKKCNRGKTPLQYACMSINAQTISVLTSDHYSYDRTDINGNPVYKQDAYGDPVTDKNGSSIILIDKIPWKIKDKEIVYVVGGKETTLSTNGDMADSPDRYNYAPISLDDILSAAALPKADLLIALVNSYLSQEHVSQIDFSAYKTVDDNNALHLAVSSQCYASVDLLVPPPPGTQGVNSNIVGTVTAKNKDGKTPLDIAVELGDVGIQTKIIPYYNSGHGASVSALDTLAAYNFATISSASDENDALTSMFGSKYTFNILNNYYTLSDGVNKCNLLLYCRAKDEDKKNSMIESLCVVFTDQLCIDPKDKSLGFLKLYLLFIAVVVELEFVEAITKLYDRLEEARNSIGEDPEWVGIALSAQGHESSWTSKNAMLNSIEDTMSSYITEAEYPPDLYFTGNSEADYEDSAHDVIPVALWNLNYLIANNMGKALKRMKCAGYAEHVTNTQKTAIENSVIQGKLDYQTVIEYLPSIADCITNRDYTFMNWIHSTGNLTHDGWQLINDAVTNSIINSAYLNGWPWQDPA